MENLPLATDFITLPGRSIFMENQPFANDFITLLGIYIYGKSAIR